MKPSATAIHRTVIAVLLLTSWSSVCADTLIHAGALIDGVTDQIRGPSTVRVDDVRIVAVESGHTTPGSSDVLIDLADYTVLPALMDMHTHLSNQHNRDTYLERFLWNEADYALKVALHARRTLMAGFTTVRDVGDSYDVTVALRKAIERGEQEGPRILTSTKSIATTGGHADPTNGWAKRFGADPGPKEGVINGPADAAKAVRQRYKNGADLIKITATGGVMSVAKSGQNPQFTDEELEAIIATASDYDLPVAAHAHGKDGMIRAIRAGVTSIEHGTYMDAEVFRLMKRHGTYYVPTIMAGNWVAEQAKVDGYFPEQVRSKAAEIGPVIQATFAAAYAAGVKIAFGTDTGVSAHGDNAQEFALMVEGGMPPMEAIQSATIVPARMLGLEADLGSLEAGRLADVIAVVGNPLENVQLLERVAFVMKEGRVYKRP